MFSALHLSRTSQQGELISYYKNEYRDDREYAYYSFMEERITQRKRKSRFRKIMRAIFPNDSDLLEQRLNECKTLAEVEQVQRQWHRGKQLNRSQLSY